VKLAGRKFLRVAVAAAALPALRRIASALDYPTRTVRVIVPFAPGGPLDVFGRLMAEKLSEHSGQQFYIENIGGAGGNIGTGRAAKAVADAVGAPSEVFAKELANESATWREVIRAAGLKMK
jgi:tripartite-type tricarboxylate transporter receptor subunit TctC